MREYTVKIKDYEQDITHTLHEWARSQNEANAKALKFIRDAFGHDDFDIAGKRRVKSKKKPIISAPPMTPTYNVPLNRNQDIISKYS